MSDFVLMALSWTFAAVTFGMWQQSWAAGSFMFTLLAGISVTVGVLSRVNR